MEQKLEVGKEYTKKEVFKILLGEEPKKGKSLYAQQTKIDNLISYEVYKKGRNNMYLITNIYEMEQVRFRSKYQRFIAPMLLSKLNESPNKTLVMAKNVLMYDFGMVNRNYHKTSSRVRQVSEKIGVHPSNFMEYINTIKGNLGDIVERSLTSMADKKIIRYEEVTMVAFTVKDIETQESVKHYIIADNDMENFILETKYSLLSYFNLEKESEIYEKCKSREFYRNLNNRLKNYMEHLIWKEYRFGKECEINFNYIYRAYKIQSTDYIIKDQLSKQDYNEFMRGLNDLIKLFIINNIENNSDLECKRTERIYNLRKNYDKVVFEIGFGNEQKERYINEFIQDAYLLNQIMIDLDCVDLIFE